MLDFCQLTGSSDIEPDQIWEEELEVKSATRPKNLEKMAAEECLGVWEFGSLGVFGRDLSEKSWRLSLAGREGLGLTRDFSSSRQRCTAHC